MMIMNAQEALEQQIDGWRAHMLAQGDTEAHVAIVESQLRDQVSRLSETGLDAEEAFLVALKRIVASDEASREFNIEYVSGLLKPTDRESVEDQRGPRSATKEFLVMLACAVGAALAIKIPALLGLDFGGDDGSFYARNLSLFVLPFLTLYFIWKRGLSTQRMIGLAAIFAAGAVFANVYPFAREGSTEILTAIHVPIVLWLAVGVACVGGDWLSNARRMEYVRFTGEWLISFALIALGGGVLIALSAGVFNAIGIDIEPVMEAWILSCAAGAVIVAAWLVETRRNLIGGMAPMLARVFTPLFAVMLVALLVGVVGTGGIIEIEREVLILFDLLLVIVLALLLYAISAREPMKKPGVFDWIQLLLVGCALAVDVVALYNIAARLSEYGFSANRTAAIGLNLILLVNLVWSAVLQTGFLRSRHGFESVERWQMRYMPVYALWAAIIVIAFPPLFGFA